MTVTQINGTNVKVLPHELKKSGTHCKINTVCWQEFPAKGVNVDLYLASDGKNLCFHFEVREPEVRFRCSQTNQMVCEDSCVELFLTNPSLDGYFNFEFNCKGVAHVAFGVGRNERNCLPESLITQIQRRSSLTKVEDPSSGDHFFWTLSGIIPAEVFGGDQKFCGKWAGNFYKCGDLLQEPHYLTWNPIDTPAPDFHRPEYFGTIFFA